MLGFEFYNGLTRYLFSTWWMYLIIGANLVLLAILIYFFPDLVTLLISTFLFFCGLIFFIISWNIWRIKNRNKGWKKKHRIIVQ